MLRKYDALLWPPCHVSVRSTAHGKHYKYRSFAPTKKKQGKTENTFLNWLKVKKQQATRNCGAGDQCLKQQWSCGKSRHLCLCSGDFQFAQATKKRECETQADKLAPGPEKNIRRSLSKGASTHGRWGAFIEKPQAYPTRKTYFKRVFLLTWNLWWSP